MPRPIWAGDRGPTFPENNMYVGGWVLAGGRVGAGSAASSSGSSSVQRQ